METTPNESAGDPAHSPAIDPVTFEPTSDDAAKAHLAEDVHTGPDTAHTAATAHLSDAALHGAGVAREPGGDPPE